eukprot:369035_1
MVDTDEQQSYHLALYNSKHSYKPITKANQIKAVVLKDENEFPPTKKDYKPGTIDLSTVLKVPNIEKQQTDIYWSIPENTFGDVSYKIMNVNDSKEEEILSLPYSVSVQQMPYSFKVKTITKIENNVYHSDLSGTITIGLPTKLENCETEHIIFILNSFIFDDIIDKAKQNFNFDLIPLINDNKQNIIACIQENQISGENLKEMTRDEFARKIVKQCNSNQNMSGVSMEIFQAIKNFGFEWKNWKVENWDTIYSMGTMNVSITDEKVSLIWKFSNNDAEPIDKPYYFSSVISMNEFEKKNCNVLVYNAVRLWRENSLFVYDKLQIHTHDSKSDLSEIQKTTAMMCNKTEEVYSVLKELYTEIVPEIAFNYEQIISKLKTIPHDVWTQLDGMDDEIEGKYDDFATDIFKRCHNKNGFSESIFTSVSLQIIHSTVVHLKQKIENGMDSNQPLLILISNEKLFNSQQIKLRTIMESRDIIRSFDDKSLIKQIDSTNTVYNIEIDDFKSNICDKNYLHDFVAVSSKIYKHTLFIFKRPKSNNIYISYNGYVRKLSLEQNNEDLYYFLPSFITFSIGDSVFIESFHYPERGTIIQLLKSSKIPDMIYYKIRSSKNVFYTLNYYQIMGCIAPKIYYANYRSKMKDLSVQKEVVDTSIDPSDTSHPMHIISLSLFESAKQAVKIIENDKSTNINCIKQSGIIYLLHKTVKNKAKSDEVKELLESIDEDDEPYIDRDILNDFETLQSSSSDETAFNSLLSYLENEQIICCKKDVKKEMNSLTYANLMELNKDALTSNVNKVYIINITETRELIVIQDESKQEDDDYDSEEDEWITFEPEEDDFPTFEVEDLRIAIKSQFECRIEFEYQVSAVHSTKKIHNLMEEYCMDVNYKILQTFFHDNNVYNEYDLNEKYIVNKLRSVLNKSYDSTMRFVKLYQQFEEFMSKVEHEQFNSNDVAVTQNAMLLQKWIKMRMQDENNIYSNNILLMTYNPIQSVVLTNKSTTQITHPVDFYRSIYLAGFCNDLELNKLYNGWMKPPVFPQTVSLLYKPKDEDQPDVNFIDTMSLLIKRNTKHTVILVPSSVVIEKEFLERYCDMIALDVDACSVYENLFLYKGIVYVNKTKNVNKFQLIKKLKQHIIDNVFNTESRYFMYGINKDVTLYWLSIGCGKCFIEQSGKINEIQSLSGNLEDEFSDQLRKAMILFGIDCKIPFSSNYMQNIKKCGICENYPINPYFISTCNQHIFCYKCILHWKEMINNPDWGTMQENDDFNCVNVSTLLQTDHVLQTILLPQFCPLYYECYKELQNIEPKENKTKQNISIPLIIHQYLLNENNTRYTRLNVMNKYQQKCEMQRIQDESYLPLQELVLKYPKMTEILAGYDTTRTEITSIEINTKQEADDDSDNNYSNQPLFEIKYEQLDATKRLYQSQCPNIFDNENVNDSVLKLLTIGEKNDKPYLQWFVDMYQRERIDLIKQGLGSDLEFWAVANKHGIKLKNDNQIVVGNHILSDDDIRIAVSSYFDHINPRLLFEPSKIIVDSLEVTYKYISSAIEFVNKLAQSREGTCPFQLDVIIAFNKTKNAPPTYPPSANKDSDDVSNDISGSDVFGNVKDKLKKAGLLYREQIVDPEKPRLFHSQYKKFVQEKTHDKYNPRLHRMCAFIDRRQFEDEMIFYLPPDNCNTFPKEKHTPLFYFETLKTCIIPGIKGYNNEQKTDEVKTKEEMLQQKITSSSKCDGTMLVLSFHVESVDEIRCYIYLNGNMVRFLPDDLKNYLPEFFIDDQRNKAYWNSNEEEGLNTLIKNIKAKLIDRRFESFYIQYKLNDDAMKSHITKKMKTEIDRLKKEKQADEEQQKKIDNNKKKKNE